MIGFLNASGDATWTLKTLTRLLPCYLKSMPEDWRAPSRDHCIPKSRGGRNVLSNIEICCRRCNQN